MYDKTNWASEASPTLGCSIEISRDICRYVGMYVGLSTKNMYAKMRGQNYMAQTCACSNSVLGSYNRPVTPVLFISTIYARAALAWMKKKPKKVHLEMRNLKQTELQRLKNRGKKG